jgi:hypothetical protein
VLAVAVLLAAAQGCASADPCRPPPIRLESSDRSTLSGPGTPACQAAREEKAGEKEKK